jgi:hypothetical protein
MIPELHKNQYNQYLIKIKNKTIIESNNSQ